jgi:hypothetical protein
VNLMVIDGYLGSGKTLGMTLLSLFFQEMVKEESAGSTSCTLYSNCGIKGSKEFTHYSQFIDVAQQPSSIIALDEAHSDLDARNFATNAVKFFTHLIFYLRKLRCTLIMATPSIENLDSRVRAITNVYCMVSKDTKNFYYDMYDLQKLKHLKRYKIRKEDAFAAASLAYDTYNMVLPVEFPQDRNEFHDFVKALKAMNSDFYAVKGDGRATQPKAVGASPSDVSQVAYAGAGSLYVHSL